MKNKLKFKFFKNIRGMLNVKCQLGLPVALHQIE